MQGSESVIKWKKKQFSAQRSFYVKSSYRCICDGALRRLVSLILWWEEKAVKKGLVLKT